MNAYAKQHLESEAIQLNKKAGIVILVTRQQLRYKFTIY